MKEWTLLLACFLVFYSHLTLNVYADTQVKIGIYDNKPLVFTDNDGKVQGFLIDILEYIGAKEGWRIEYVPGYWVEGLERLANGEIDLLGGIEYSRERNEIYDFTYEKIFLDWGTVYTQEGLDINQIVNLDHMKIAVAHDDIHYRNLRNLADQFRLKCRFVEAYEYDAVMELVHRKRVDAGVVSRSYGLEHEGFYDITRSPLIFSPAEVYFAVPKRRHGELIKAIDGHLVSLKSDKQSIYHKSLERWTPEIRKRVLPAWLTVMLAIAGGLLLISLTIGFVFREQVKAKTAELSLMNRELLAEIGERKRVENALRLTQFSIDRARDPVFWLGLDARFIYVNEAACSSLGYASEELISKTVHDIDPDFPAVVWPDHWEEVKQQGSMIIESRHRTKDDRILPVEISVNYLEFEDKEYICAFARDITERKQAEEERERMQVQLREAQKMEAIGTLAGGIAHDFNNLLQAVQGYAELLLLDRESDEPEHQHLQRIVNAAKRGSVLTQQLLTFSRRVESKLKPIDLNRKILGIKEILLRTIPKMIEINLQLGGDVQAILADPVQIEQILMNLAVNAKDAMTEGGELVIETKNVVLDNEFCLTHSGATPGDYVLLTISDTGQGMDEQTLEHIFEPFFTTKGVGKGTGLGLATVYGIVKSHLGYISCDSKVDKGTTFEVYFPAIAEEEVLVEQAEAGMVLAGGDETILLVDDEDYNRDFGREILAKAGYRVRTAVDAESALEVYLSDYEQLELYHQDQERIALVILDLIMPGIGGRKCLAELLSINPKVKVLIASGYSEVGSMKNPLESGAKGFLGKPYEIKKMLKVVREVLDGK